MPFPVSDSYVLGVPTYACSTVSWRVVCRFVTLLRYVSMRCDRVMWIVCVIRVVRYTFTLRVARVAYSIYNTNTE